MILILLGKIRWLYLIIQSPGVAFHILSLQSPASQDQKSSQWSPSSSLPRPQSWPEVGWRPSRGQRILSGATVFVTKLATSHFFGHTCTVDTFLYPAVTTFLADASMVKVLLFRWSVFGKKRIFAFDAYWISVKKQASWRDTFLHASSLTSSWKEDPERQRGTKTMIKLTKKTKFVHICNYFYGALRQENKTKKT